MKQKILRIELIVLFALAFLNFVYFYYREQLPDNFYEISSTNTQINFFTYYGSSLLAHLGFYTGVWVFTAFVAFGLIYSFVLAKKKSNYASLLAVIPVTGTLVLCYLVFPETVGEGLVTLLNENSTAAWMFFALVLHGLTLYYLVAPGSFKSNMKSLGKFSAKMAKRIQDRDFSQFKNISLAETFSSLKLKVLSFKDRWTKRELKTITPIPAVAPRTMAPIVQEIKPQAPIEEEIEEDEEYEEIEDTQDDEVELSAEDEDDVDQEEDTSDVETIVPVEKKKKAEKASTFFASDELIDCVAITHRVRIQDPEQDYFTHIGSIIEDKLEEFGISSNVVGVMKGPVVDTFELNLGAGVKVSSVSNRADDVSLALSGAPIRMVYPMKGKTTVGVEVPRNPRDFIYLEEVLRSPDFKDSAYNLPIAMGKDAYGRASVVDLTSMPHMLVAGTTGSGKSVFVNTLLVSLIVKNSPENLKLILIDPKSVELALFQTLPHLIMPTVTDPSMASIALLWAVEEMERRYALLREVGVRNIDGFNRKIATADGAMLAKVKQHFEDDSENFKLPFLVIVVDEVADLIQSKHGKEIETNVSRLAAKARAAGIHLVLATQRPSTDVITGVIKANFPTRIAFKVITNMDSRVILDSQGAEKLLGKGDMLFKQGVDILRVHSAYVDEAEIEKLVDKLKAIPVQYSEAALEFIQNNKNGIASGDGDFDEDSDNQPEDALYSEAVDIVARTRQASASWLQRRMNVGYNRAAKLIEAMERKGIVGPGNGAKPRQVLVPPPDDLTS